MCLLWFSTLVVDGWEQTHFPDKTGFTAKLWLWSRLLSDGWTPLIKASRSFWDTPSSSWCTSWISGTCGMSHIKCTAWGGKKKLWILQWPPILPFLTVSVGFSWGSWFLRIFEGSWATATCGTGLTSVSFNFSEGATVGLSTCTLSIYFDTTSFRINIYKCIQKSNNKCLNINPVMQIS